MTSLFPDDAHTGAPDPGRAPDFEASVRRALLHEAATITPRDRLGEIQARAAVIDLPAPRRSRWPVLVAAAAAAAVVVGSVSWLAGRPGPASDNSASSPTSAVSPPSPADPGTGRTSPSGATTPAQALGHALPVYYIARGGEGWRLFRTFLATPAGTGSDPVSRVRASLAWVLDPPAAALGDQEPVWAGTSLVRARVEAGGIELTLRGGGRDLSSDAQAPLARAAVQQLVFSAQAAAGLHVPVTITRADGGSTLLGRPGLGTALDRPARSDSADLLSALWIDVPGAGQSIDGAGVVRVSALALTGAPVRWRLSQGEVTLAEGEEKVTADSAPTPLPGQGRVRFALGDLPPGDYRLELTQDASGASSEVTARVAFSRR